MTEIFGTSFLTIHGDAPSRYWLGEIAKLTDDQCRSGLERVIRMKREYPVNLTEFVEACRPTPGSPRFLGAPTTPERLRALAPPKAKPEHVARSLASIREKIGRATVPSNPAQFRHDGEHAPELLQGSELEAEKTRQLRALRERYAPKGDAA
jgi:hypothetical protein